MSWVHASHTVCMHRMHAFHACRGVHTAAAWRAHVAPWALGMGRVRRRQRRCRQHVCHLQTLPSARRLQVLHAAMLAAVAARLQPLDAALARAWVAAEIARLVSVTPDEAYAGDTSGSGTGAPHAAASSWQAAATAAGWSPALHGNGGSGSGGAGSGPGTQGLEAGGCHGSAPWRGKAWWLRTLPSILVCVEPDDLIAALAAALPRAGALSVSAQRGAAGLACALLGRSPKAARSALQQVRWSV